MLVTVTEVNQATQGGATPLYISACLGQLEVVRVLVTELGANMNQAVPCGISPVMSAAYKGHNAVVKWLTRNGAITNGADTTLNLQDPSTAAEVAKKEKLARWLESKSACANSECAKDGEKRCARCRKVRYCSRECQVTHYLIHKATCGPPSYAKSAYTLESTGQVSDTHTR